MTNFWQLEQLDRTWCYSNKYMKKEINTKTAHDSAKMKKKRKQ